MVFPRNHDIRCQSDEHQSTLQDLWGAVEVARAALNDAEHMPYAARRLREAEEAVQSHLTPDYYCDVPFDSIFSFDFALGNDLRIMY